MPFLGKCLFTSPRVIGVVTGIFTKNGNSSLDWGKIYLAVIDSKMVVFGLGRRAKRADRLIDLKFGLGFES